VILLGDKDQLASVEAGAVLADLCRDARAGRYTPATRDWLARVSGERISVLIEQVYSKAEKGRIPWKS
jgi:exodeoxyribonuclease V alpha subunit